MGYGTRSNGWNHGGSIRTFWPDDTETEFYITGDATIHDICARCRDKWGYEFDFESITITPEYIHTDCLGYDRYDSGDYTLFLRISKEQR